MVVCPRMFLFLSFPKCLPLNQLESRWEAELVDPAQLTTLTRIYFPSEVIVDGAKISIPRPTDNLGC